jgi:hypothetical protein
MHPVAGPRGPVGAAARGGPYTAGLVTQRPALGCLFEIVETLVLTLIIFVVIQNFVAQPYQVKMDSMERTLEPEQYVLVDKLTLGSIPTSAATSSCSIRRLRRPTSALHTSSG